MPTFDRSLDAIIITNPDQDHIGGLSEILKNYSVGIILEPGTTNSSQTYQNLKKEIEKENIPNILAKKGMILDLGNEVFIEILFPNQDVLSWDRNDGSLVARLFYKNNSILLMGDATSKTEKILLANYSSEKLKNDILKIGHHGSRSSTSRDFLQVVDPQYALISSGFNNNYGHPHQEVLDLLFDFNVQLFRTDQLGMLKITMDGLGYKFAFSNNLFNK
jgi:competence protein ComEC